MVSSISEQDGHLPIGGPENLPADEPVGRTATRNASLGRTDNAQAERWEKLDKTTTAIDEKMATLVEKGDAQGGWERLYRTLRDMDEGRVVACRDDMNTLLLFTGLYAAVLTPLLVESYKTLQEDPQANVVPFLQQISANTGSYVQNGASLNATASPLSLPPPFHVIAGETLVNVCWFASLILSLGTASFAILVKQWLQEYLNIDKISPQECIRIRHLRYQGVKIWRLFEIAAILPFFLQVALALFFVGLCAFTSLVHSSIANTSFCMVGGWATSFFFALLAPMVIPGCPYRIAFLPAASYSLPISFTSKRSMHIIAALFRLSSTTPSHPYVPTPQDAPSPADAPPPAYTSQSFSALFPCSMANVTLTGREDALSRKQDNDLVIFRDIDSAYLNDSLLNDMRVVLKDKRTPFDGQSVLAFVVALINHRLNTLERVASLQTLPRIARTSLAEILGDSLLHQMNSARLSVKPWYIPDDGTGWLESTLRLLIHLIPPEVSAPKVATLVLWDIIRPSISYGGCTWLSRRMAFPDDTPGSGLSRVLSSIVDALNMFETLEAAKLLRRIIHTHYFSLNLVDDSSNTYDRLIGYIRDNPGRIAHHSLLIIAEVAATVLMRGLDARIHMQIAPPPLVLRELASFVLSIIRFLDPHQNFRQNQLSSGITLHKTIMGMLSNFDTIHLVLKPIESDPDLMSTNGEDAVVSFFERFILDGATAVKFQHACGKYFSEAVPRSLLSALKISFLIFCIPADVSWFDILTSIDIYIKKAISTADLQFAPAEIYAAQDFLQYFQDHDFSCASQEQYYNVSAQDLYEIWLASSIARPDYIPDTFIATLRNITLDTGRDFWRVRRIDERASASGLEEEKGREDDAVTHESLIRDQHSSALDGCTDGPTLPSEESDTAAVDSGSLSPSS